MKNVIKLAAIILAVVFVGCSDSDSDNLGGIANTPLKGKVHGTSFVAQGGKAFVSGNNLSINITNVTADCNSSILDYTLYVSTDVENKVGSTTKANVVFNKKGETPLNKLNSTVTVEKLTSTEVTVKIKADSTGDNTVEGTYTVPFCK
ncbi:hypothetical protein F7018_02165 [Tenacibaculum aiptasiae]|uniref:Uncharacterized protein n=1 Tax=Tenacibaculum aiptasiae TaxID=426481 RepID=A0A7J5AST8_9FLAO|nr:hypothetical protein [Tenacibaculum aiptasiae]KAB1160703.1 hypothetical protein F7018_02165 [Tenacibaculum aiptasiae]